MQVETPETGTNKANTMRYDTLVIRGASGKTVPREVDGGEVVAWSMGHGLAAKVKDTWKDFEVVLEVDLDRLTAERAQQINSFWTSAVDRLDEEDGDVVRTVIRLAGLEVMCEILEDRGADFGDADRWYCEKTTQMLHDSEGWGGRVEGDSFGWCGIRVVGAEVDLPCFEDVAVSEVSA